MFAIIDTLVVQLDLQRGGGQLSIAVRLLRLARMLRLVKLLRAPFLKDSATMLTGLFIGASWLIWVMVLFTVIIYVIALGMRLVAGPAPGDELKSDTCGYIDMLKP